MEKSRGLKVLDLKMPDFLRSIEHAVQLGTPVLMQDVLEEMDPSLDPILSKAIMRQGSRLVIKIGDNTVDYNENFRFYLTTKLANPHYSPEACASHFLRGRGDFRDKILFLRKSLPSTAI